MKDDQFLIPNDLRDSLMQYFSARPWREAEPFMHALGDLKNATVAAPDACQQLADNGYVDA